MKKILIFLIGLLLPICINALEMNLYSKNAIVYDTVDKVNLYELGDSNEHVKIASLTKIMTSIVALENIENLDEEVTINLTMLSGIPWDASIAGLKLGDVVTKRDLVYASLLPSGADATNSLAYIVSGSVPKYVELMNKKAKEIGMNDTNFVNVTGYDRDGQYSTVNDVLKMLLYALENETFKSIYTTKEHILKNGLKVSSTLNLYNKLYNFNLDGIMGSKTGYTDGAGTCMSALINSNDRDLIVITLGAPVEVKKARNMEDLMTIKNTFDESYDNRVLYKNGDVLFSIPVENSKIEEYSVKAQNDVMRYLENSETIDAAHYEYEGKEKLSYKDKKGDKIGSIKYYWNDELLGEEEVKIASDIEVSYLKVLTPYMIIVFGVFLIFLIFKRRRSRKRKRKNN